LRYGGRDQAYDGQENGDAARLPKAVDKVHGFSGMMAGV